MKKYISIILSLTLALSLAMTSCQSTKSAKKDDEIVIIYTNDTHCGIADDIGFAGVAAYKKYVEKTAQYVTLVDCGDAIQGETIGTVTEGEAIINIMNAVGYDVCTFGNHEFDYGTAHLAELLKSAKAEYVCCNINYLGASENPFKDIKPYTIKKYGSTKVAYIGVVTPTLMLDSAPVYFMEDGYFVYNFGMGDDGQLIYEQVQTNVDAARKEGADYVVLLSHCGIEEGVTPYRSTDIIANTTGINAVLDGHSHSEIPCTYVQNKDGNPVCLTSTGTKINNIGQLVIQKNGTISASYIEDFPEKDEAILAKIEEENQKFDEIVGVVVGNSTISLDIADSDGVRMIRSRELPLGDLIADSLRTYTDGVDIALINGGGIRAGIKAGEITYKNVIDVMPFMTNLYTTAKVSGQVILDMFEYFYQNTASEYVKDGKAYGEFGSFHQVSGIRFTIDTSIPSSVVSDENGDFVSVGDTRRVQNVEVLKDGVYVPLDPTATYVVAGTDYMLMNGGSGTLNIRDSFGILDHTTTPVCLVLRDYIAETLSGEISSYKEAANRIIVK